MLQFYYLTLSVYVDEMFSILGKRLFIRRIINPISLGKGEKQFSLVQIIVPWNLIAKRKTIRPGKLLK